MIKSNRQKRPISTIADLGWIGVRTVFIPTVVHTVGSFLASLSGNRVYFVCCFAPNDL